MANPILIGLLGIFCGAIIVATFHCIASGCSHQQQPNQDRSSGDSQERTRTRTRANAVMMTAPERRFRKEFSDEEICSVCLCEFNEGEQIRVLPECLHLFHVACIDMWLNTHSNCPLCRTNTEPPDQHVVEVMPDSVGDTPPEFHQVLDSGG